MRYLTTLFLSACTLLASLLAQAGDCPVALPFDMYALRSTYHGECANGLAHGQGRINVVFKANGKRFAGTLSGQFAGGTPNGPGSFVTDDGQKRFDGIFRDGAMWEGRATSVDQDGTTWVDEFQGGRQVSRQPMRPAYGERNAYTPPGDAQSYQGNGYAQEQPQQTNPLSGLVSSIAQIALNSGAQALERKYQEKYGGQQVDPAQRTLEEHREINRRNREALEAERAQRHKARENAWKQEQAQREREQAQRQAVLDRQYRKQEAERARQAQADQQRFEEQRSQDEARLAEFYADRERRRQERGAASEQERTRQQEISRQMDEARWLGAEQERIQQQEYYRQIEEGRQARIDRANQEAAAQQAEAEQLAQQDRDEAERQRLLRERDRLQIEVARLQEEVALRQDAEERARLTQERDRLQAEAERLQGEVEQRQRTQPVPSQPPQSQTGTIYQRQPERPTYTPAPPSPHESTPAQPLRYEDVLSPQEIAWVNSLPVDNGTRNFSPDMIQRMKNEGRWDTYVTGTNYGIQAVREARWEEAKAWAVFAADVVTLPVGELKVAALAVSKGPRFAGKALQGGKRIFQAAKEETGDLWSRTVDRFSGRGTKINDGISNSVIANEGSVGRGYSSFSALKQAIGPAGDGKDWHHVVEQSKIYQFGSDVVNNPHNVIALPRDVHNKISAYYSTKQQFTGGLTVRDWLKSKSFDEQYDFGIGVIKQYYGK